MRKGVSPFQLIHHNGGGGDYYCEIINVYNYFYCRHGCFISLKSWTLGLVPTPCLETGN